MASRSAFTSRASLLGRRQLPISFARSYATPVAESAKLSIPVAPTPGPSRFRRGVQTFGRVFLGTTLTAAGVFLYVTYTEASPGTQLPQDPTKKNLVVLGSGWAATSFLKEIDTEEYNVTVISPRNYFLFTPLLPSVTVGTLEARSIIQPTRYVTRHKKRAVNVIEAEAKEVDPVAKTVTFEDISDIKGKSTTTTMSYDYLVYGVGCENQTFGMKGVTDHACFLKELSDAEKIRAKVMDCVETAAFPGQSPEEIDRLMHMVVVGGGPTGVEYAGELHDFLIDDLRKWYPEVADKLRITLVEALPNVLPAFSKRLIQYTESTFKENKIDVLTQTMVKDVQAQHIVVQDASKQIREIPYGLIVWATGNTARPITRNLMAKLAEAQTVRRGLAVDDHMKLLGAEDVWAVGDCTATTYAPTAQVGAQQGTYLAKMFVQLAKKNALEKELAAARASASDDVESLVKKVNRASKILPFKYSHQGALAYIGSEKAIADLPMGESTFSIGGAGTYWFWRSAYLSNLYSLRNRTLVATDWVKVKIFGRDVSRE